MKKLLYCLLLIVPFSMSAQSFTQKAPFPGPGRTMGISFTLGNDVYTGTGFDSLYTGNDSLGYYEDLWKYNTVSDTWTQLNNVPFRPRAYAGAIVVNGVAYAGLGIDTSNIALKDWWEYDAVNDSWTQKADLPGEARYGMSLFSWNGKGYVIGGESYDIQTMHPLGDLWAYTPATDSWVQEPDFSGIPRDKALCEVKGDTLYYGLGQEDSVFSYYSDIFKYNLVTKVWTPIAPVIATANVPVVDGWPSTSFVYNDKLIVMNVDLTVTVPDDYKSVYVYDMPSGVWTVYPLLNEAGFRVVPSKGQVGSKAYVGLGWDYNTPIWFQDMWEIDLQGFITGIENANPDLANIRVSSFTHTVHASIPAGILNKGKTELQLYSIDGRMAGSYSLKEDNHFDLNELPSGNYSYVVRSAGHTLKAGILSLH